MDIISFIIIQSIVIFLIIIFFLIRALYIKNKKLEDLLQTQDKYLREMYETIKYTENRIKTIDQNGIFQGDDEVGFFFKAIKEVQDNLSEYIKFIK
jgi:predicted Holliday junction resolvase-like endonuclease